MTRCFFRVSLASLPAPKVPFSSYLALFQPLAILWSLQDQEERTERVRFLKQVKFFEQVQLAHSTLLPPLYAYPVGGYPHIETC